MERGFLKQPQAECEGNLEERHEAQRGGEWVSFDALREILVLKLLFDNCWLVGLN